MRHRYIYLLIFGIIVILITIFVINDNPRGVFTATEYDQFKKLCESTGGEFFDDCEARFAEFCENGKIIDGKDVACDCPDPQVWSERGCI